MSNDQAKDMWEQVDAIDWASLNDAYGAADYVPQLLRDLASGKSGGRDEIWEIMYGGLFHQGSIYPATVKVIPFLIEILRQPDFDQPARLLLFLAQIGAESENIKYLEKYIKEGKEWAKRELENTRQALALLPEGLLVFVDWLDHPDQAVRKAALAVLAWCGPKAASHLVTFLNRPNLTQDDLIAAYLALGRTARMALPVLEPGLAHISQQVQMAACLAWILSSGGNPPKHILRQLRDILISNVYRLLALWLAELHDALGTPDAYLAPLNHKSFQFLLYYGVEDPLAWSLRTLKNTPDAAMNLVALYIEREFSERAFYQNVRVEALSRREVGFLTALAESEAAWLYDGNMSAVLRDAGIRFCHDRPSLLAFLNQPELTRVMVLDPSWSANATPLCVDLGYPVWQHTPFIFYHGDTDVLDALIPEDPADFPREMMDAAAKVAGVIYREVVKKVDPALKQFRFYVGKTIQDMRGIAGQQGWVLVDPPEKVIASTTELNKSHDSSLQEAEQPDLSHQAALRLDDLQVWQRADLELFVHALDDAGWAEAANWHKQHFAMKATLIPIGFARYLNAKTILEAEMWFYDDYLAAVTGKRTGFHYLKLAVIDRLEEKQMIFRLYYQRNLDPLLDRIIFHQDEITVENVVDLVLMPIFKYLVEEQAVLDLGDYQLVAVKKKDQEKG